MESQSLFLVTITTMFLLENVAYSLAAHVTVNGKDAPELMDMDDESCMTIRNSEISMESTEPFIFTWMALNNYYIACHKGWFGDRCQYQCGCKKGECASNGSCLTGDHCDTWWFGPTCQYQNLAHNQAGIIVVKNRSASALMDHDDSTCVQVDRQGMFTFGVEDSFIFTWMMLVIKETTPNGTLLFSVLGAKPNKRTLVYVKERQYIYGNTVHICDLKVKIQELYVSARQSLSLCSWYISGGRNFALRQQNVSQTSTKSTMHPRYGVDGERSKFCTGTYNGAGKQKWSLFFPRPLMIHRIRIYSHPTFAGFWIGNKNFSISTYDPNGSEVHLFKDPNLLPRPESFNFSFSPESMSRIVVWVNGGHRQSAILFCELEAWGDCPLGYYGLGCAEKCPVFCPDRCSVFDGQCSAHT